jgi:hypothetical protein
LDFRNQEGTGPATVLQYTSTRRHPAGDVYASSLREADLKTVTLLGTLVFVSVCAASLQVGSPAPRSDLPRYTSGDELARPEGYREWVFLSSRLRVNSKASIGEGETFGDVFVSPSAYHQFCATGSWPDKTVFVLEKRMSLSKSSAEIVDHYETVLMGISVEVKDTARFAEKWAYFTFDSSTKTAKANPKAMCWQCHNGGGAVENTYVQFYPTLKPLAQQFGTYRQGVEGPDSLRE